MVDPVHLVGTTLPRLTRRLYPDALWRIPTCERVVYLTFDDGPTLSFTAPLLEILAHHGAKATFFLIGRYAEQHPNLVRAVRAAGHSIGNHTYSHAEAWKLSAHKLVRDLERGAGAIEAITGERLRFMRPPWGQITRQLRHWCLVRRQRLTMWDVGPGDFLPAASAEAVERRILRAIKPGSIVVLHDHPMAETTLRRALPHVLSNLSGEGWQFRAL